MEGERFSRLAVGGILCRKQSKGKHGVHVMVARPCNSRTLETKAGKVQVQGQPELHSEFQDSLA